MPKYIPVRPGILGWLLFLPFIALYSYAFYHYPWLFSALTIAGIFYTLIVNRNLKARLAALATVRRNESICTFAKSFDTHEVDTWVIRAVYEQLQTYLASSHPQFPVRAEDRLNGCLISDPDDLDLDLVSEISERTGRSLENTQSNPYYGKVETVRDLVLFFNAQPLTRKT